MTMSGGLERDILKLALSGGLKLALTRVMQALHSDRTFMIYTSNSAEFTQHGLFIRP